MPATRAITVDAVTSAAMAITTSARFNPPTSRTKCSLYGPSPLTQWRPNPGKSS